MAAYFERRPKDIAKFRKRPLSLPILNDLDTFVGPHKVMLPTPEERLKKKARNHLARMVSINMSSFQRQSEYRTSQGNIATYGVIDNVPAPMGSMRRRKRLMTSSGGNLVFREQSAIRAVDQRSASKERWERAQSMNIEHYASKPQESGRRSRSRERKNRVSPEQGDGSPVARSCSLRRSFRSLFKTHSKGCDLWAQGRPRSPGPPVIIIDLPFRRSRSLPRSLRVLHAMSPPSQIWSTRSASTEARLDTAGDEPDGHSLSSRSSGSYDIPSRSGTARRDMTPHRSTGTLVDRGSSEKIKRFPSIRRCQSSSVSLRIAGNLHNQSSCPVQPGQRPKSMDVSAMMSLIQPIPVATPMTPADSIQVDRRPPRGLDKQRIQVPWAGSLTNVRLRASADKERESSSGTIHIIINT